MQVGDSTDRHDDLDTDSLFGSPPPSPGRGRSPSPLALPGGQNSVQNVGTLALPGSHLCSELPSALPPVQSVNASSSVSRQCSQPPRSASQAPPPRSSTVPPGYTVFSSRPIPVPQRRKRVSRRSTSAVDRRPTPPPIELPSLTDPPPTNFLRNQQALLGHAGLISRVNPAKLALQRHMHGKTPENPIVVEDEDERPSIGQRPLFANSSFNRLPVPSSHEILANLVKQKNLIPVMDALVRLVAGSAFPPPTTPPSATASSVSSTAPPPTASSSSAQSQTPYAYYYPYQHNYPYYYSSYGYTYLYSASTFQQPAAPYTMGGAPEPKRRKLSDVPAGATEWDVPYPFPEGQGPPGYHQNWQTQRGQQLVEDLVGLVKSAAKKAAVQKAQEESSSSTGGPAIGSVEYYRERVLRHYRPHTRYDLRPTLHPVPARAVPAMDSLRPDPTTSSDPPSARTDAQTPEVPLAGLNSPSATIPPAENVSSSHFALSPHQEPHTDIPESTSGAAPDELPKVEAATEHIIPPAPDITTGDQPDTAYDGVLGQLPQDTAGNIDDLLSVFNDLPAGELDALLNSTDFSSINPEDFDFTSVFDLGAAAQDFDAQLGRSNDAMIPDTRTMGPNDLNLNLNLDMSTSTPNPMFAIDPELLALPHPGCPPPTAQNQVDARIPPDNPTIQTTNVGSSTTGSGAPPTPTLVGSPMSQVDFDPPTPDWNLTFPEPEIAGSGSEATHGGRATSDAGIDSDHVDDESLSTGKGKGKRRAVDAEMDVDREDALVVVDPPPRVTDIVPRVSRPPSRPCSNNPTSARLAMPWSASHSPSPASFNPMDVLEPLRKTLEAMLPQPSRVSSLLVTPPVPSKANTSSSSQVKDRDDILRRARVMRQQLSEEIERAKVELWETAMEGGCLAVLAKERDKVPAEGN